MPIDFSFAVIAAGRMYSSLPLWKFLECLTIPVAANWLVGIDAGSFGLLDVLAVVDLINNAVTGLVELAQEQLFVGFPVLLSHGSGAAAEDNVVFDIGLCRVRRSQCSECNSDHHQQSCHGEQKTFASAVA